MPEVWGWQVVILEVGVEFKVAFLGWHCRYAGEGVEKARYVGMLYGLVVRSSNGIGEGGGLIYWTKPKKGTS